MGEAPDATTDPRSLPTTVEGIREAWAIVERTWRSTFERVAQLPEPVLQERVDDEWSFVETQRHLLFATDVWIRRSAVGDCRAWHRLGMPPDHRTGQPDPEGRLLRWGIDVCATPTAAEVLHARDEHLRLVRDVAGALTPEQLEQASACNPPWIPAPTAVPVSECFRVVINEEWLHHGFARRDLAALEQRA